jgi:methylmalonyl-CoA mutase, C-terminal domain
MLSQTRSLNIAIQEHVDVIGVSSLGGAHITLGKDLIEEAVKEGFKDRIVFIIGGIFSIEDESKLKDIGFDGVFTAGATKDEIVDSVKALVESKSAKV